LRHLSLKTIGKKFFKIFAFFLLFFHSDRQLRPDLKYPFAALSAETGAASAAPNSLVISKMVKARGWFDKLTITPTLQFLRLSQGFLQSSFSISISPAISAFFFATVQPFICFSRFSASNLDL